MERANLRRGRVLKDKFRYIFGQVLRGYNEIKQCEKFFIYIMGLIFSERQAVLSYWGIVRVIGGLLTYAARFSAPKNALQTMLEENPRNVMTALFVCRLTNQKALQFIHDIK